MAYFALAKKDIINVTCFESKEFNFNTVCNQKNYAVQFCQIFINHDVDFLPLQNMKSLHGLILRELDNGNSSENKHNRFSHLK